MRTGPLLIALLTVAACIGPAASSAQELIDRRKRDEYRIEPASISLDRAVEMAQSRYRAKAVKAETISSGDRRVHQIRLLSPEGKVWTVRVDAETGRMY